MKFPLPRSEGVTWGLALQQEDHKFSIGNNDGLSVWGKREHESS